MVLDSIISSPLRRSQNTVSSPSFRRQFSRGAGDSCSGLSGRQKALCHVEQAEVYVAKGKLKVF